MADGKTGRLQGGKLELQKTKSWRGRDLWTVLTLWVRQSASDLDIQNTSLQTTKEYKTNGIWSKINYEKISVSIE
jgi:hypothetical protein